MPSPRPYQIPGIRKLSQVIRNGNGALDMSETGLGKTWKAGFIAKELGLKLAVVAPPVTHPAWEEMAWELGIQVEDITSYHAAAGKRFPDGFKEVRRGQRTEKVKTFRIQSHPRWKRVGPLRPTYKPDFDKNTLVVFDEIHYCRDEKSLFTKLPIGAKRAGLPILMLSATPFQTPLEMKAIMHVIGIVDASKHWSWCQALAQCVPGQHGGLEFRGGPKTMAWINGLIRPFSDRVLKKEVGDLPELDIQTRTVPVSDADSLDTCHLEALKEAKEWAALPVTERLRFRQISEHLKIQSNFELIQEYLRQGKQTILFYNFDETRVQMEDLLRRSTIPFGSIYGGVAKGYRQRMLGDYKLGDIIHLNVQIGAGGAGLNAHDVDGKAERASIVNLSDSAFQFIQAAGRTHRDGAKSKCTVIVPLAAKSVEMQMKNNLNQKFKNLSALTDGDLYPKKVL